MEGICQQTQNLINELIFIVNVNKANPKDLKKCKRERRIGLVVYTSVYSKHS